MSRYLVLFALVALAAAYPANDGFPRPITTITETDFEDPSPWFRFPPFGNIFGPLQKLFSSFADVGPRIKVSDDIFQVIANVKDYKKDDLKVKVKGDFILVQGAHEAKQDDHDLFASQFFHTYTLPLNATAADVTATLTSDGFLVVDAPINGANEKDTLVDREVPIVESGKPLKEETDKEAPVVPTESTDKVENDGKVENSDNVETLEKVENNGKVPNVENVDNSENVDNVAKVESSDKVPNVENVDNSEKVDKVEKVEPAPSNIPTESPILEEGDKKEPTTASPDLEAVTEGVQDNKLTQDNEVNEISDANEIKP